MFHLIDKDLDEVALQELKKIQSQLPKLSHHIKALHMFLQRVIFMKNGMMDPNLINDPDFQKRMKEAQKNKMHYEFLLYWMNFYSNLISKELIQIEGILASMNIDNKILVALEKKATAQRKTIVITKCPFCEATTKANKIGDNIYLRCKECGKEFNDKNYYHKLLITRHKWLNV